MASLTAAVRKLPWWVNPMVVVFVLTAFGIYSFIAIALYGGEYRQFVSPFYSPEVPLPGWMPGFVTAPMLVLWIPLGFRATCYYYRKAYYRAFFWDPPACKAEAQDKDRFWAGGNAERGYRGERALFVLNNVHRYFLYASIIVVLFLWYEAFRTLFTPGGFQIGVGSLLWFLNIVLVSAYTFSCHSLRHIVGGRVDCYSCVRGGNVRHKTYNWLSVLNRQHALWAWLSLFSLLATDIYLRLLQTGVITDFKFIG